MMSSKHGHVACKNSYALDDQDELCFCPAVYSKSNLGENTISSLSALKVYIIVPQEILFPERKYCSHLYFSHTYLTGKDLISSNDPFIILLDHVTLARDNYSLLIKIPSTITCDVTALVTL